MRRLLFISTITITCLILTSCQGSKERNQSGPFTNESFRIKRGTNIAHWLSQSRKRGEERAVFFTEKDVKYIDSIGFDHIRLPIDEEQMWDEGGKRNEDAFALMKNCLDWCSTAGLRVIIDLHILRSHHFNEDDKPLWTVPAEQDKFISLWKDLSAFLKEYPTGMVAYEPMNEPVADDPEQWNQLLGRLIDSVRIREPARVLVVGSNRWQSAATFDTFRVPENDTNLILSYHFYEPFFLTHYKAGWTDLKDFEGKVNYPGQIVLDGKLPEHKKIYNLDTLEYMMRKPLAMAERLKLPLYCGEFGIYKEYFPESKLNWYSDMITIFRKHGVAYANWNYKSTEFGIVDSNNVPFPEVTKILLGKK